MTRIFITGSADGLGLLAGKLLVEQGHDVVLHARNAERAAAARSALPRSEAVVGGDVSAGFALAVKLGTWARSNVQIDLGAGVARWRGS